MGQPTDRQREDMEADARARERLGLPENKYRFSTFRGPRQDFLVPLKTFEAFEAWFDAAYPEAQS